MPDSESSCKNPYDPVAEDVIADWLMRLDVSGATKEVYKRGFRAFCAFVRDAGLDFDELTQLNILDFKDYLNLERELAPNTVSTYLLGVRSFFSYAEQYGDMKNAARGVKGVRQKRAFKKEALTASQVRRMLDVLDRSTEAGLRDYAMLNLMVRCGLRDIEVVRADVRDITEKAGCNVLMVHGKGRSSKDDFVVLTDEAHGPIEEYLEKRGNPASNQPLFASIAHRNGGSRLTTRSVSRIAKTAMERAGIIGPQYTAHSLRHTAVTLALLGGATEREAQQMARHASLDTTMLYSHDLNRVLRAAERKIGNVLDR